MQRRTASPLQLKIHQETSVIARLLMLVRCWPARRLAQNVVHYAATNANVKYLFATAEPVAHLKSGDILDTNTLDCFGNAIKKPGDTLSMAKGDNPLTGPFFVEGAEPGRHAGRQDSRPSRSMGTWAWARSRRDLGRLMRPTTRPCCIRRCRNESGSITSIMRRTRRRLRRSIPISR